MTESHAIELKKLKKKHNILRKSSKIFLLVGICMLIIMLLESFEILDIPFYEQRLPISHRVFLNTWVGIPIAIIERKIRKIDTRIREIESIYDGSIPQKHKTK